MVAFTLLLQRLAWKIFGVLGSLPQSIVHTQMSSASTENTNPTELPHTREIASPEPTVPLSVFLQLQARLEQLELSKEQREWSSTRRSEVLNPKRRSNIANINHDAQCRSWRRWFSAQQSPLQDVRAYYDYLDTLVKELDDRPDDAEFYWRLRTSIKPSIRDVLDLQIIQPNNCEDLMSLALRIEENEKSSPRQDSSLRQSASQTLATGRRPNQAHSSPRHQGRASAEAIQRANGGRGVGRDGGQAETEEPSRRSRRERGGRRHHKKEDHETQPDRRIQNSKPRPIDRAEKQRRWENNLCFECGAAEHRSSECNPVAKRPGDDWTKSLGDWTAIRESRPSDERSRKPNNTAISWDPPPQPHTERFQSPRTEHIQDKGFKSRAITYTSKEAHPNQSRWSPNGNTDAISLLD